MKKSDLSRSSSLLLVHHPPEFNRITRLLLRLTIEVRRLLAKFLLLTPISPAGRIAGLCGYVTAAGSRINSDHEGEEEEEETVEGWELKAQTNVITFLISYGISRGNYTGGLASPFAASLEINHFSLGRARQHRRIVVN